MTKLCDFKRDNPTVLVWLKMTLMKMFLLKFLLVGKSDPVDGAAQGLVDGQLSKLSVIPGPSRLGSSRDLLPEDMNLSEQGPDAHVMEFLLWKGHLAWSFLTSLVELCQREMNTGPQGAAVMETQDHQIEN